jgi:hypothetical protein
MDKRIWKPLAMTLAVSAASVSHAYADVDIDNDGLIEISTLQQLDLMRYDLAGTSLNGDSTGCPATGCNGYELVADLDFDTNGNGVADEGDLFWNSGEGWEPIPSLLNSEFNGNGHVIKNLSINREGDGIGLFSHIKGSFISNLNFYQPEIYASSYSFVEGVGTLAGHLENSDVERVSAEEVNIRKEYRVDQTGLLIGHIKATSGNTVEISNIKVSGSVVSEGLQWGNEIGGLAGYAWAQDLNGIEISDIDSSIEVHGGANVGGIIGDARNVTIAFSNSEIICVVYSQNCGGVVGKAFYTHINDTSASGDISAINNTISVTLGGLAGHLQLGSIERASFEGVLRVPNNYGLSGGIVGYGRIVELRDIEASGNFTGGESAGGIVGALRLGDPGRVNKIERTYAAVTMSANSNVGGVVANYINYQEEVTDSEINSIVESSYWDSDLTPAVLSRGGEGKTTFELQCPTVPGDVSCDASMYSDWDETIWDFGTSSDYPELIGDLDGDGIRNDLDVDIDNDGLIEISTLQQLDLMRYDPAGTSLDGDSTGCPTTGCNGYELVADLDFDTNGNGVADEGDLFWNSGEGWEPIPSLLNSEFNGNGHVIKNLSINREGDGIGLFSHIKGSFISNLNFYQPEIYASSYSFVEGVGTLAGHLENSDVERVSAEEVNIRKEYRVDQTGLLIGHIKATSGNTVEISNIKVSGSVVSEGLQWGNEIGGLAGYAWAQDLNGIEISDIDSSIEVHGGANVGGIIGDARNVTIAFSNSEIICVVYSQNCGGVVGKAFYTHINDTSASGDISAINNTISVTLGGLAGHLQLGSIERASFEGVLRVPNNYGLSGGIVGYGRIVELRDIEASGNFTGGESAGGIVGALRLGDPGRVNKIERTYAAVTMSANSNVGGVVANYINYQEEVTDSEINSIVESSYWDSDLTPAVLSRGGEGKTTFELQCPTMPGDVSCDASMYSGWDDTIWDFGTSSDYPVLR